MKQVLQPDHYPRNNFQLKVTGLGDLTLIEMSGIEEEIDSVELPDRTFASGGHTKPFEFTFSIAAHHLAEPVAQDYKKNATLIITSISGSSFLSFVIEGMFLTKWKNSDNDSANEGELHTIEFTAKGDKLRLL